MAIKSKIRPTRQTANTPHQKMSPVSEKHPEKWIHPGNNPLRCVIHKDMTMPILTEEAEPYQTATPYLQMCVVVFYSKQSVITH